MTNIVQPAWIPCPCCDEFLCTIHHLHVHECSCPPIDEWDTDPYTVSSLAGEPRCSAGKRRCPGDVRERAGLALRRKYRMTTCETCGAVLEVGTWPFCPHGQYRGTVISDSIPGGQLIENLGPDPVTVYSETQRRQIMKERGLVDYVRHRPGSPLTSNWDTVTQKTLDDAAELVSRERRLIHREPSAEVETLSITITERGSFTVEPEENPQ